LSELHADVELLVKVTNLTVTLLHGFVGTSDLTELACHVSEHERKNGHAEEHDHHDPKEFEIVAGFNVTVANRCASDCCEVKGSDVLSHQVGFKSPGFAIFAPNVESICGLPVFRFVFQIKQTSRIEQAGAKVHDKDNEAHLNDDVLNWCRQRCFAQQISGQGFESTNTQNLYEEHHRVKSWQVVPVAAQ
jgi:hypothetical protein